MTATNAASAAYIVAGLLFIMSLAGLSKHETAKSGITFGIAGMVIALAATVGSGRTTPCAVCHGADLKGLGPVPNLAGRSPSYLARQMYDMKLGTRKGALSALMMPVLANLTDADIVDLIAFIASREP